MRRNLALILLVVSVSLYAGFREGRTPPIPPPSSPLPLTASRQAVPPFTFTVYGPGKEGVTRSSDTLRGKAILLNFWASWCAPCAVEFPALLRLAASYGPDRLILLAVSVDHDPVALRRFLDALQEAHPTLYPRDNVIIATDPARRLAQDVFQTLRYPETLLIGKDLTLRGKVVGGEADWSGPALRNQVDRLVDAE